MKTATLTMDRRANTRILCEMRNKTKEHQEIEIRTECVNFFSIVPEVLLMS